MKLGLQLKVLHSTHRIEVGPLKKALIVLRHAWRHRDWWLVLDVQWSGVGSLQFTDIGRLAAAWLFRQFLNGFCLYRFGLLFWHIRTIVSGVLSTSPFKSLEVGILH